MNDYSNAEAMLVPSQIVKQDKQGQYLYIIDNVDGSDVARKMYVETGLSYKNRTEITQGLKPGSRVIVTGYNQVTDGTEVRVDA